jgi:hypothetical protein
MATIILTTVGTLVGGPIGGAIGAALGQQIDSTIFAGKPREGPRLKELDVQTSSYGTQVPAIFGAMRVAGTVIWSTDLIERKVKSRSGKGRPSTLNYSYSVSFAVALSSRPIARIGRIWADGNILRGAAGDFKTETEFRFYAGHADQPLDPLMASAETSGQCAAHRDLAYVVFEDFQLADYGNRIPSLTFEIFERNDPVPVMDIFSATSAGAIGGNSAISLVGYAVQGADARSALSSLDGILPLSIWPENNRMVVADWAASSPEATFDDAAITEGRRSLDRARHIRAPMNQAPSSITIRHYEPDRDFQAGVQTSRLIGNARTAIQIDFPAAIDSAAARSFADIQALQKRRGLNGYEVTLPRGSSIPDVGDVLTGIGANQSFRITEIEHQRGTSRLHARDWLNPSNQGLVADPGRSQPGQDLTVGETRMILADLPAFDTADPGHPLIAAAVAGTGQGWRRAALSRRDGSRDVDIGGTTGVAVMGSLLSPLVAHTALIEDQQNRPVIRLLHERMTLPAGVGDPFAADAPAIWLDGEVIRYGQAEKIALQDYRLSRLVRGCFNTPSSTDHVTDSSIFLLDGDTVSRIDDGVGAVGSTLLIEALGIGDAQPVAASAVVQALATTPFSPVHGQIVRGSSGELTLSWIRRDRLPNLWADGVDIPNSEGADAFIVKLHVGAASLGVWQTMESVFVLDAAQLSALNISSGAMLRFEIAQQGRYALSSPLVVERLFTV